MSDEIKKEQNQDAEQVAAGSEEKQTNRTFTQSEFDSMLAKQTAEMTEKIKGFSVLEKKYSELESKLQEKEESEMSELQKLQSKVEKLTETKTNLEKTLKEKDRGIITSSVLADPKYASLPTVYKRAIPLSDSKEEVIAEAERALEQYQKDFERASGKKSTPVIDAVKSNNTNVSGGQSARDKLKEKKKRFGLFH